MNRLPFARVRSYYVVYLPTKLITIHSTDAPVSAGELLRSLNKWNSMSESWKYYALPSEVSES